MLVGAVVVAPLLTVCAILVTVSSLTSRQIAQDLGDSYVESAAASVQNQVGRYLADAVRVSEQYTRRIERGVLPTSKLTPWEPVMLDDLATTPSIASICFGNVAGESTWLLHNKGRMEVGRGEGPGENQAVEYVMKPDGSLGELIRRYLYDPRARPWWGVALSADKPTWTPVYFWFGTTALDGTASTGHTRPIRNESGELMGVLIVDVTLGDIGGFLHRLSLSSKAYFYIVDDNDLLVATSHGNAMGPDGNRITLARHSSEPAQAVDEKLRRWRPSQSARTERITFGRTPAKMSVVNLSPYEGINWRLICVLPESEFLTDANSALRREVFLSAIAILAGVLLALMLGRQVTQPLIRLTQHIRRVGAGDFNTRLELEAAHELRVLSDAINQMAGGLRDHMHMQQAMEVAREVQQSLLPDRDAYIDGLEISGRSRYCDETGGDYFDYLTLERATGPAMMISIGDVMGHGVAAALLMTSARAALRVHASNEGNLGKLLTRVNDLLAQDAKHGSFMTMALVAIDARQGALHWASAGHDLPMIYHTRQNRFASIRGSHIPLGVMEATTFEEYEYRGLAVGDVILLGTDGVWETQNAAGELFGRERTAQILRLHHAKSASLIAAELEAALGAFRGNLPPKDDITFVIVKLIGEKSLQIPPQIN